MKRLSLISFILLFLLNIVSGQNLAPNPSFEDNDFCPFTLSLIDVPLGTTGSVIDWYRPTTATSDYFNACATAVSGVSVPTNFAGDQAARTGDAYTGLYAYSMGYREYIEAPLARTLSAGHKYYVSYWVSLATNFTGLAVDQMGAFFSADSLDDPISIGIISETPQVVSPVDDIYDDSEGWEQVSGEFTAAGGERWVTIGNFTPDADINTESVGSSGSPYSYYYVEDVCIIDLDSATDNIIVHDTVSCDDSELILQGRPGMSNYTWDDGSTLPTRTISLTGTYWVKSIDHDNCELLVDSFYVRVGSPVDSFSIGNDTAVCTISEITLAPDPAPDNGIFRWSDGSSGTSLTVTEMGQYWLEVKNGCYSYTDTINIVVAPASLRLISNDTLVCEGAEIPVFAVGSDQYSYQWIPEDGVSDPHILTPIITVTGDATYILKGSFPGCPDTLQAISFTTQPAPSVVFGSDTAVCPGTQVILEPSIMPVYDQYTYTWTPVEALDGPVDLSSSYFIADTSIIYYLTVSTPIGCSDMDSIKVSVFPPVYATVMPDTGICPRDSITLWINGDNKYLWYPSDGLSNDHIATPVASPSTPTNYSIFITNEYGCSDTQYVAIEVHPNGIVSFPDSVQIWPGESYQLDPQGNCLYFQWFPPSGLSAADISNPVAQPEVRTRYFLTASTEYGCSIKDSIDILVNTESVLDIPNAFVPGNGDNSSLKIVRRGFAALKKFQVFNRWGNIVFETTNIDRGWDGTFNGAPQPMGVYIYSIEAETSTGRPFVKQGNITLIR